MQDIATNYREPNNWARFVSNPTKKVDVFHFYGTQGMETDLPDGIASISDDMKFRVNAVQGTYDNIFSDYANIYVPFYRQLSLEEAERIRIGTKYVEKLSKSLVMTDVYAALDYYFENANEGRPFILSGHSQGSAVIMIILQDYMKRHPEYLKRMIAAYAVGYGFTREWLNENKHVKFASGETDTGVIVSWNTEGPGGIKENIVVLPNSISINPINWRLDETPATIEENKGSLVSNIHEFLFGENRGKGDLPVYTVKEGRADATLDTKRGVVVCTTAKNYMPMDYFGDRSLHTGDWPLYFGNVKENVGKRIEAYFTQIAAQ